MTKEQKAKAYDEALKRAEAAINIAADKDLVKGVAITIFPELKESEDEKIRKELIAFLKENHETGRAEETWSLSGIERWIAWLEKQKDAFGNRAQNITANMLEDRIEGIQRELIEFLSNTINASWADIIKSADCYAQRIRSMLEKQKEQKPVEWSKDDEMIRKWLYDYISNCPNNNFAFYGGVGKDAVLNYLEKQKAAETPQWMIDFLKDIRTASINKEGYDDYVRRQEYQSKVLGIIKWLENQKAKTPQWIIDFLKEMRPYSINKEEYEDYGGRIEFESKILTIIKWLEGNFIQQKEQKPSEWSEEEKEHLKSIISTIERVQNDEDETAASVLGYYESDIAWLKSLPERFNLQPKNEWSKEDERMLRLIINAFRNGAMSSIGQEQWLKSLPERFNLQPQAQPEQKPETKITGWVARDRDGKMGVYEDYPERDSTGQFWLASGCMSIDQESFPNIKWETGPVEVEMIITKKKC